MQRVSLVGHGQIPQDLVVPGAEIRIFSVPGGTASSFFEDSQMTRVLEWTHDLCILWIGSNDVTENTSTEKIINNIVKIVEAIEDRCEAIVQVVLLEPRVYPNGVPVSETTYMKVQKAVNRRLKKVLAGIRFHHFISRLYRDQLAEDGVHFKEKGRKLVRSLFTKVISDEVLRSRKK